MTEKQKKRCPSKITKSSKKCCSTKTVKSTKKHCGSKSIKTSGNLSLSDAVKKQENQAVAVKLPKNYYPSEKEPYMNPRMSEFFKNLLHGWHRIVEAQRSEIPVLESCQDPDTSGRAQKEDEVIGNACNAAKCAAKLKRIDAALGRIEDGTYGYCVETGNPIGVKRLLAEPDATLCIEAKEELERYNATHAPNARR